MNYNIQLGFLATDAIQEFSRAANNGETERYPVFLKRSAEYCQAVRQTYSQITEANLVDTMPESVAAFMRALVKDQRLSPAATAKLAAVQSVEQILTRIQQEQRQPSSEECLAIARNIYSASAADPR